MNPSTSLLSTWPGLTMVLRNSLKYCRFRSFSASSSASRKAPPSMIWSSRLLSSAVVVVAASAASLCALALAIGGALRLRRLQPGRLGQGHRLFRVGHDLAELVFQLVVALHL